MVRRFLVFALLAVMPSSAPAEPTAPFSSIELRSGGHVTVRHGASHEVSFREGDASRTRIAVAGGRLVIDNCPGSCPHGYSPRIDIVAPRLDAVAVDSGGSITVEPGFPAQDGIAAAVAHGGGIDIRRLPVARVAARVANGGMIFTRPGRRLDAAVSQGGAITYWGDPAVSRSVRHGGVVQRGRPTDAETPVVGLAGPRLPVIPPLPPLPPQVKPIG